MTDQSWKIPGGGNSFPFDNYGDYVKGIVFEFEPNLTQTDKDGKPKTFPGGQEMKMHRVGLHVLESSNPAYQQGVDASVYLKGGAKLNPDGSGPTQAVVLAAIKAATGLNDLQPGAKLTVQYVAEGQAKDRMTQPPKFYKAWYEAPTMTVPQPGAQPGQAVNGNGSGPTPPPGAGTTAPAQQAPTAAPATSPAPAPGAGSAAPAADAEAEALAALAEFEASQQAAQAPAWDSDPRVAPLRAKGIADETIRQVLKI